MKYIVTCKRSNAIYRQFMKRCLLAVTEELCQDYEIRPSLPSVGTNLSDLLKLRTESFYYHLFAVDGSNDIRDTVQ